MKARWTHMNARCKGCRAILMPLILLLLLLGAASAEERASEGARREAPREAIAEKGPAARAPAASPANPALPGAPAAAKAPPGPETAAGPQNIKDRVAVWVFLTWVWGTTIVSIAFLRLKIRECDRLHAMAFQEASRRPPQEEPNPA